MCDFTPTNLENHLILFDYRCSEGSATLSNLRRISRFFPSAPAPGNRRPDTLVKIIPGELGDDFEARDRTCDFDPACHEPADCKGVERAQRAPTAGFEHRPCVCFSSAE